MAKMSIKQFVKSYIVRIPILGGLVLWLFRFWFASRYVFDPVKKMIRWVFASREIDNFTYDLTPQNKLYMAAFIAQVTGKPILEIQTYFKELENDTILRKHLILAQLESYQKLFADQKPLFGRRIGWYGIVRALKPKVVIETGVDKGLGACVITAALLRNTQEKSPGYYYGTEINPEAGYLLSGDYAKAGTILYGDSIESLKKLDKKIDLFINDSDHSINYEAREYQVIKNKLTKKAIIIGDNAHVSGELLSFSRRNRRKFLFFQENPSNHWYPGGGIGVSY